MDVRHFSISVSDDGFGMPDIDISSPDSLGLRLVKTLVAQLGAEMQLDSSAVTTFTVEHL